MSDSFGACLFAVGMAAYFGFAIGLALGDDIPNPATRVGRAQWRRNREVSRRACVYIVAGLPRDDAEKKAEAELKAEAREVLSTAVSEEKP